MRTVSYRLADLNRAIIPLGFVGENQHTRILFDAKKVFDDYPAAVPSMTVQPPQGASYPAVVVRDGDIVTWDVSDSDLIHSGTGELQLAFIENEVKVRTFIARTRIDRSIVPTGEIPEPMEDFLEAASAAVAAIPQEVADGVAEGFGAVTAEAETLAAGSGATAEFDTETKVLTIGVPVGADGQDGAPGADGFSPVASVTKSGDTATISITDKTGTTTATVKDGTDGQDGQPGADGYSPSASVSKSGATVTIMITDKSGTTTATVSDGTPVIDDTAGSGDTDKVWSADKSADVSNSLNSAISAKYEKPSTGIPVTDLESGVIPSVPVQDVQVNGTSILSQGVANVPKVLHNGTDLGVCKVNATYGMGARNDGTIFPVSPSDLHIKDGANNYECIKPANQHTSIYYGLAKLAGADMANVSGETVGVYPEAQKIAIQKMLGVYREWEKIAEVTTTEDLVTLNITTDLNGQSFELSEMLVKVWLPASTTGTRDYIAANNLTIRNDDVNLPVAAPTKRYFTSTGSACYMQYESWIKGGNVVSNGFVAGTAGSTQGIDYINYTNDDIKSFRGFRLAQYSSETTLIPSGTVVKLYGIRKY